MAYVSYFHAEYQARAELLRVSFSHESIREAEAARVMRVAKIRLGAEWISAEVPRTSQIIFKEWGIAVT